MPEPCSMMFDELLKPIELVTVCYSNLLNLYLASALPRVRCKGTRAFPATPV